MANKKTVGVYIGRFQPFHDGHKFILGSSLWNNDLTIVLIGSADQARTTKNPFTVRERARMIRAWATGESASGDLAIMPLRDQPYNNAKWIQSVQETVNGVLEKDNIDLNECEISLVGFDRDDSTWYLSAFPQWKRKDVTRPPVNVKLNATQLRDRYFGDEGYTTRQETIYKADWKDVPDSTFDFLKEFRETPEYSQLRDEYNFMERYKKGWEAAPYPVTFVTVDNVVIQSGHVLVVERGQLPGKGLWALPGGFVNQKETLQQAAVRELLEETGLKMAPTLLEGYIKAKEIFDDPNRSLRGRTITTAFLIRLDDTKPLPKVKGMNVPAYESGGRKIVETAKAFWLPINDARARSEMWFEDHHAILDTMLGMIKD